MERDNIQSLREEIDEIDSDICELLIERFQIATEIAAYKRQNCMKIEDKSRERTMLSEIYQSDSPFAYELASVFKTIISNSKRIQRKCYNVYLIGMSGAGKSRNGKKVAAALKMSFVDTDKAVAAYCRKSIDLIFDTLGESAFRQMESEALRKVAQEGGAVVATGGGIICDNKNIELMKSSGFIVFFDKSIEQLLKQSIKNRPLLREGDSAIIRLHEQRLPIYQSIAHLTVNPDSSDAINKICAGYDSFIKNGK